MTYKLVKRKLRKKCMHFFSKGLFKNDIYLHKHLYDNIENFSCLNTIEYTFAIHKR